MNLLYYIMASAFHGQWTDGLEYVPDSGTYQSKNACPPSIKRR